MVFWKFYEKRIYFFLFSKKKFDLRVQNFKKKKKVKFLLLTNSYFVKKKAHLKQALKIKPKNFFKIINCSTS